MAKDSAAKEILVRFGEVGLSRIFVGINLDRYPIKFRMINFAANQARIRTHWHTVHQPY